jgi:hypothetical protein
LNISYCLLMYKISAEKLALSLVEIPLNVKSHFFLAVLKFSLSLTSDNLFLMCHCRFFLKVYLISCSLGFLHQNVHLHSQMWEIFRLISLNKIMILSSPFEMSIVVGVLQVAYTFFYILFFSYD